MAVEAAASEGCRGLKLSNCTGPVPMPSCSGVHLSVRTTQQCLTSGQRHSQLAEDWVGGVGDDVTPGEALDGECQS